MYKVSVIIPVYNKENYIRDCLKSVISQSYTNIEIILVDDGSTDSSYEICHEFAIYDSRIKLLTQCNSGPACARNNGIDNASGDFIVFVDADDYIAPDYIENLMAYSLFDLVVSGYFEVNQKQIAKHICSLQEIYDINHFANAIFSPNVFRFVAVPYLKLYKTRIIKKHKVYFQNIQLGEDTVFVFEYLRYCKNFTYIEYVGYYNRIVSGTLSRKKVNGVWQMLQRVVETGEETFHYRYTKYWQFIQLRMIKIYLINDISSYSALREAFTEIIARKDLQHLRLKWCTNCSEKLLYVLLRYNLSIVLYLLLKIREKLNNN